MPMISGGKKRSWPSCIVLSGPLEPQNRLLERNAKCSGFARVGWSPIGESACLRGRGHGLTGREPPSPPRHASTDVAVAAVVTFACSVACAMRVRCAAGAPVGARQLSAWGRGIRPRYRISAASSPLSVSAGPISLRAQKKSPLIIGTAGPASRGIWKTTHALFYSNSK